MLFINSIRNIIAIVFIAIGRFIAVPNKEPARAIVKPPTAIDFKPTSDFKVFLDQLSKKEIKGGPAVNKVFAMCNEVKEPLCYDLRIHTTFTDKYSTKVEQRILRRYDGAWRVVAAVDNNNIVIHGIVDDLILGAAAQGWNCTGPASSIISNFIEVVLKTQKENRAVGDTVVRDVMHVQFFMPHPKQVVKLTARVYDPTSAVLEINSPHITIPFFKAIKKSRQNTTN